MSLPVTPIVPLDRISAGGRVRLLAKLEWFLPTGSVKDRIALAMVDEAESNGLLRSGGHLLEPSSGNTGIALARLARLRGYRLTVVMPSNVSRERKDLAQIFGAEIIETPGEEGSNGAIRRARQIAGEGDFVLLDQYSNEANPRVHFETTGREILSQVGHVDAFVACLGTGGTLMGVARALREAHPDVRIIAAEPPAGETIAGLRSLADGYTPEIFDPEVLDAKILVRSRDAIAMSRRLLNEEGLFAGLSSGAAVHAALRWAGSSGVEGTAVIVLPDGGWKYVSTGAWLGTLDEAEARLADQVYF